MGGSLKVFSVPSFTLIVVPSSVSPQSEPLKRDLTNSKDLEAKADT